MPDTGSPKVTMSDEEFPPALFASGTNQEQTSPGWLCPAEDTIAAYVDGTLDSKARFESHLAKCEHCRRVVADVVKTRRDEDPSPPPDVARRARRLAPESRRHTGWVWVPAGAAAVLALVIVAVVVRRHERIIVSAPSVPNAPLIAKSSPPSIPGTSPSETVRKPPSEELLPNVVFPKPDSVVAPGQLRFNWMQISQARSYEIRIVASDGDLVWEGQTETSSLRLPARVALKDGSYFVWITAYLQDGRTAKSSPVPFLIKR